jgi:hypothetical protein
MANHLGGHGELLAFRRVPTNEIVPLTAKNPSRTSTNRLLL